MSTKSPAIEPARLRSLLDGINAFGFNAATGGFNRMGYSDADMAARRWLAGQMRDQGLSVTMDAVANLFGRFGPASGPCVMVGSHVDTVPEGGAFDGALGVCVALECVLALRDAGFEPRTAIEVVATAEEEGRFGGMLGSQAIAGTVAAEWLEQAVDADGVRLAEAMRAQRLDPAQAPSCRRPPGSVSAFVELHVEQGPVLEQAGRSIGVAHSVSGVSNIEFTYEGRANHSGTTPMSLRADAFAGLAAFATAIPDLIRGEGTAETRITVGKVDLEPNFPHTVPGRAVFSVITRDTDDIVLRRLVDRLQAIAAETAAQHGLGLEVHERSWIAPVRLDEGLAEALRRAARGRGLDPLDMPSGAGHDAQTMQAFCPSALLFVPSRGGISHAPEEYTAWENIETGASVVLDLLVELASRDPPA